MDFEGLPSPRDFHYYPPRFDPPGKPPLPDGVMVAQQILNLLV